jgi:hypothetical protein
LLKVDMTFIVDIKVFEVFAQEYLVLNVLIVLLAYFVTKLAVKLLESQSDSLCLTTHL